MMRILQMVLGLALLLFASHGVAQVGAPLESLLAAVELRVVEGPQDGVSVVEDASGLRYSLEQRGQALARVAGEALFDPPGLAASARVMAAATGYFEAIEQPLIEYFRANLANLAGQGTFPVSVEGFELVLAVEGDAAPFRVRWAIGLAAVPEELFPPARHALGPSDARYVVREFSDLQCPFCARYAVQVLPILEATLLARGDVRFEYHHFALGGSLVHGALAAEATECVSDANEAEPKAFWRYTEALFVRQSVWSPMVDPSDYFIRLAPEIGLSGDGVEACLAEGVHRESVLRASSAASLLGIRGTPTVFVGPYQLRDFGSIEGYLQAMGWIDVFAAP
jgi:protein-disulfide isomerase